MRIFSVILPGRVSGLIFSEFLIAISCYLAATFIFAHEVLEYLTIERGWLRLLIVAASVLIGIFVNNLYAKPRVESRVSLVLRLCNVIGIALIVQGLLAYVPSGLTVPRLVMLTGSALVFFALLLWRLVYTAVVLNRTGERNVLFLGSDSVLEEIAERIREHSELGFGIAGYLADQDFFQTDSVDHVLGPYLGSLHDLESVVSSIKPARIIVGLWQRGLDLPVPALLEISQQGMPIEEASMAYESICGRVCSRELRPSQLIFRHELGSRPGSVALQSIYTNLIALIGIIVTSPLMILIALVVKLTSRGPILEPDIRVGLHGIPFSLNRFRCYALSGGDSREERITAVGRWLQRLHLVNLPRLFNLVRGEIALVGPKPERPEFADQLSQYFAFYRQRHSIKPGMTGWSQIHTPPATSSSVNSLMELEYDLYYTKHISLALDAYILLHGVRSLLPFARH